jgi:hypothetical protein
VRNEDGTARACDLLGNVRAAPHPGVTTRQLNFQGVA